MPKAIMEFDLNDPDDKQAHLRATKSLDMALAIWEIVYNTKKTIQWEIEDKKLDPHDTLDRVFEQIWQELNDHGINPDELIT